MIVLTQRKRGYHWWENDGVMAVAANSIAALEEGKEASGGWYGTKVTLTNGTTYVVAQRIDEILAAAKADKDTD